MWNRYVIRRKINSFARRAGWTWAPMLPLRAWIDPTSRCNLKCRTCPVRDPQLSPNAVFEDMAPEIYDRIRRELLPSLEEVTLSGGGEPFLAPVFYGMLEDMCRTGKRVQVVTNGTIVRPDAIEKLVRNRSMIRVSLDGTTPEVMDHVRPGARLDRVLSFMQTVKDLVGKCGHPEFRFELSFVITRSNVEQMTECVELAHRYGVHVLCFGSFQTFGRTDEFARESLENDPETVIPHYERARRRAAELGLVVSQLIFNCHDRPEEEWRHVKDNIYTKEGRIRHCPLPWRDIYIGSDGLVRPCCAAPPEFAMGHLRDQSVREIWNGPKYRELRRTVNTPEMPEVCKNCFITVRL